MTLTIPAEGAGLPVIASVSGGKDSTALILALRESEIDARFVFADTGWEAPETYVHLDHLRELLQIDIDVVEAAGGMLGAIRERAIFPGRMQRWCTRELKLQPLRKYFDAFEAEAQTEAISAIGVRAAESRARRNLPEWEDEGPTYSRTTWGGFVWRPLIRWTVEDVLAIHHRHGVPVNPLYQRGHDRVGCYPCIFASKADIALIAEHTPERINLIRELESWATAERQRRNEEQPGRYGNPEATFFQTRRKGFSGIDQVVAWARTERGGRQLPLLPPAPRGGCMRWGLCEAPTEEAP